MVKKFRNKTVIISGGATGIGKAIVLAFAKEGASISFSYFKSKAAAIALKKNLEEIGANVKVFQVDIRDYRAVSEWVGKTKKYFGAIDIAINNSGIFKPTALAFTGEKAWKEVVDTNFNGVFNLAQAVIVDFIKRKSGIIINVSSVNAIIGGPPVNYSASKAAVIGFTKSLAREVGRYNIRVNALAPGLIDTEMIKDLYEEHREEILERVLLRRLGTPEEVARLAIFLAGKESSYITGQTIVIDGGYSLTA
jgi:3-oxoacyl-[acyl-carrier protein] reductase